MNLVISDRTRLYEIIAATLVGIGKLLFIDYWGLKLPYIIVVLVVSIGYVIYRYKKQAQMLQYWGFRTDNFAQVFKKVMPFGIFAVLIFMSLALYLGNLSACMTWHLIPILLLYPIWGTMQQFLIISLVLGNLQDSKQINMPKYKAIGLTAVLFALVHYPHYWLVGGTFLLALFYGWVYWSERNLYVLGLFHGTLGALFYYAVLNRDPFEETFGKLLSLI